MRLIDADKLIASLKPEESVWVGLVLAEQVANAETIDAIPIEWIKKKIKEKKERFVGYCDELTPVFVMYEQVLSDWEKENETN